jgi:signal transduction histidine kinase
LNFFYNSFAYGEDIFLLNYKVSHLEFVVSFYILLVFTFYNFFQKINLDFILVQIVVSISLLIIGEYTYFLVVQFIFLFVVFEIKNILLKQIFYAIYLLSLHKALLLCFSSFYLLYFFNLALVAYGLFSKRDYCEEVNKKDLFIFGFILILLISILTNLQDAIFDLYIWIDLVDTHNYQVNYVIYILSIIHIFIFSFIWMKQKKLFNFKLY